MPSRCRTVRMACSGASRLYMSRIKARGHCRAPRPRPGSCRTLKKSSKLPLFDCTTLVQNRAHPRAPPADIAPQRFRSVRQFCSIFSPTLVELCLLSVRGWWSERCGQGHDPGGSLVHRGCPRGIALLPRLLLRLPWVPRVGCAAGQAAPHSSNLRHRAARSVACTSADHMHFLIEARGIHLCANSTSLKLEAYVCVWPIHLDLLPIWGGFRDP